ncbi:hypothetical protein J5N97_028478 [Dioscorea zingiberensis]|uniref:DUF4378 domain-containing protein n=1 Tax=Dioscorea zingiberensis TaxID=325984 RepID=A0A9D5BZ60_9LILI|nr:hypothetical protein J5N97_028478 [Dioscorea zingiberensis]
MASIPNPLSGERRLFELLEEQQEPFLLDVYLLENGYSDKMFDSKSPTLCWPGNACKKLIRMSSRAIRRRRVGFFRCIVTKILQKKAIRKAMDWNYRDCKAMKFDRLSFSADDSSPVSPVSVLDLNSDDSSSQVCNQMNDEIQALHLFEELLMTAYKKTKWEQDQSSMKLISDCEKEIEQSIMVSHECLEKEKARKIIDEQMSSLEKQRGDISNITKLIALDVSNSTKEWSQFHHEIREIGMQIEAAIFEEIKEELVQDMLN